MAYLGVVFRRVSCLGVSGLSGSVVWGLTFIWGEIPAVVASNITSIPSTLFSL